MSKINHVGKKYGRLTVISEYTTKNEKPKLECICDCGNKKLLRKYDVIYGATSSCGCLAREIKKYKKNTGIDLLPGCRFGRLTIVKEDVKNNKKAWLCSCQCGKEIIVFTSDLITSSIRSCGCYKTESIKNRNVAKVHNGKFDIKSKIGQSFGFITVLSYFKLTRWSGHIWKCKCKCGNLIDIPDLLLKDDNTIHCGCVGPNYNINLCNEIKYIYEKTKKNALKRGLEFTVSIKEVWDILIEQNRKCKLSNIDLDLGTHSSDMMTASIDRINSNLGYIVGNIQWLHKYVNISKSILENDDYILLCKVIADNSEMKLTTDNKNKLIDNIKFYKKTVK